MGLVGNFNVYDIRKEVRRIALGRTCCHSAAFVAHTPQPTMLLPRRRRSCFRRLMSLSSCCSARARMAMECPSHREQSTAAEGRTLPCSASGRCATTSATSMSTSTGRRRRRSWACRRSESALTQPPLRRPSVLHAKCTDSRRTDSHDADIACGVFILAASTFLSSSNRDIFRRMISYLSWYEC